MVGVIDELEDRELVRRERHPTDRRAHRICLTPRARDVFVEADNTIDTLEHDVFACLNARK
jgi:DNA-binding MarR family transcriptional regulator